MINVLHVCRELSCGILLISSLYLQAVIKATSSLKLERKCSYFTRYRKWFEEMRQSALQRHISLTSLSMKSDGEEELYNTEEIIEDS